jgi:hypothetical protein
MNGFARATVTVTVALAAILALLNVTRANQSIRLPSSSTEDSFVFLPVVYGPLSPAGDYYCYELEFGLIWTSEVITLDISGSSTYAYHPPNPPIVTGTWVYTPATQEVGFTNFRWLTTTYLPPSRLWARRYLTYTGFEIAVSCSRLE